MLEDPWSACTAVQVTEVAKQQASSTRHRFRLFTRLEQTEDKDGMEDLDEPGRFLIMTYRKVKALVLSSEIIYSRVLVGIFVI